MNNYNSFFEKWKIKGKEIFLTRTEEISISIKVSNLDSLVISQICKFRGGYDEFTTEKYSKGSERKAG